MKYNLSERSDKQRAIDYLNKLIEKGSKIELKEYRPPKTNRQNRYLNACYKILSDYSGYTVHEIKQIMKMGCEIMKVEKGGHVFLRSAAELDTQEMTIFIDYIRAFGNEFGCYIMSPDEFYQDQFNIEKSLNI